MTGPAVVSSVPQAPRVGTPPGSGNRAASAPAASRPRSRQLRLRPAESWLALGVVLLVALLIIPLPPALLDAALAMSLGVSILVLLVTLTTSDPLDFSVFPSLLLLLTLLRLGLNVNSTRLILGTASAGEVIKAFGDAVIGGNFVVGLVIFLILVVINFTVITKGAGRIAEVAARFTLDAMPGRQMSIDADLGAGLIDEDEARRRREEITRYADFYGSMDGAAKFVRGDAIAGLIITGINLMGGFVIGMTQLGMTAGQSLETFSSLTVGDGLVTQIPALVVSTAAGVIVTYGQSSTRIGPAIAEQLTRHATPIWMASGVLGALAIMPGFPTLPFVILSGTTAVVGWTIRTRKAGADGAGTSADVATAQGDPTTQVRELLHVDPLELEVGYALIPLVDESRGGDLLKRIALMRNQVAGELGVVVPAVRVRDNIQLGGTEYAVKLRGVRVARGDVMPQYLLALNANGNAQQMDGIRTTDPSFGMPALWIGPDRRAEAESNGYTVVEPQTVLSTHLMETIRRHSGELLGRQETQELLDGLKETNPALVEDIVPNRLSLGTLHRVLQRLLREGVPIRDLVTVLEALSDAAEQTKDPEALTETVRRQLSSTIVQLHEDTDGAIRGITLGPRLEMLLMALFSPRSGSDGQARPPQPDEISDALRELHELVAANQRDGQPCPLITPPTLRVGVRRLVEPILPAVPVISLGELPPQTPIHSLATWELPRAA